jgi:hypothetical protein
LVPETIPAFFWFFDIGILCHPPRPIMNRLGGFNGTDHEYIPYLERLVNGQVPSSTINALLQVTLNNSAQCSLANNHVVL